MRRPQDEILNDLIFSLKEMVEMMRKDPECKWVKSFEGFLERGRQIAASGYDEHSIRELCSSIRSISSGNSPFNDYVPAAFNRETRRYTVIPGTENYNNISRKVDEFSEEIRTIGTY